MSGTSTNRRTVLGLPLGVLFASAMGLLKTGAGNALAAPLAKKPHARSRMMPYIDKRPFVLTIEHADYNAASRVSHAAIWDSTNTHCLGHWLPFPDTQKGQKVKGNRITVVFDTSRLYPGPAPTTMALMPASIQPPHPLVESSAPAALMPANIQLPHPPVPSKITPAPITPVSMAPASVAPVAAPVIGSGSIVVVTTTVPTDTPPTTDPIVLDPVEIDTCP